MNQSTDQLNQPLNSSLSEPINLSTRLWLKVILLIAAFVFSYFSALSSLIKTWLVRDVYSYGFLIPFISLYLVWHERKRLKLLPIRPSILCGMILTLLGSLMFVLGKISSTAIVQQLSIIVILPSLVLLLLGIRYLKALFLPLSYLTLMVPVLDGVIERIHWPFQLFSATIAANLLRFVKISVFQNSQYLELPNITLEVADACSGVRYLISTIALSIPLAFVTQKNWVRRVLLVIFAIVISIGANPLRITFIGMWSYYGKGDIHGPIHIFQGYFIYVVGLIFLFLVAWVFYEIPSVNEKHFHKQERTMPDDVSNIHKFNQAWLMSVIILLALGGYLHLFKPKPVHLKASLYGLPSTIGEWKDAGMGDDVKPLSIPGADFEIARVYRNASGREVKLQITYFESQAHDKKLIYYKFKMLSDNSEEISIQNDSKDTIRINKTLFRDSAHDSLILYWFDLNGRIVANNYKAKFITAIDGLIHKRTNGAIIIISTILTNPDEMQSAFNDEVEFVQKILPILDNYLS